MIEKCPKKNKFRNDFNVKPSQPCRKSWLSGAWKLFRTLRNLFLWGLDLLSEALEGRFVFRSCKNLFRARSFVLLWLFHSSHFRETRHSTRLEIDQWMSWQVFFHILNLRRDCRTKAIGNEQMAIANFSFRVSWPISCYLVALLGNVGCQETLPGVMRSAILNRYMAHFAASLSQYDWSCCSCSALLKQLKRSNRRPPTCHLPPLVLHPHLSFTLHLITGDALPPKIVPHRPGERRRASGARTAGYRVRERNGRWRRRFPLIWPVNQLQGLIWSLFPLFMAQSNLRVSAICTK